MLLGGFKNNAFSSNTGSFAGKYSFKDFVWVAAGIRLDLVNSSDQPDDVDDDDWKESNTKYLGLHFWSRSSCTSG